MKSMAIDPQITQITQISPIKKNNLVSFILIPKSGKLEKHFAAEIHSAHREDRFELIRNRLFCVICKICGQSFPGV